MMGWRIFVVPVCVLMFMTADQSVDAQENLAQEAYAIIEQNCLICHGPHGSFTEQLVIQNSQTLIDTGKVIPGNPDDSIFYQRLIETAVEKRMPLGQPPLPPEAIQTIRQWIQAGAPDWNAFARTDINFITTEEMLQTIENHVAALDPFDRSFARYFTSTHLYNAGEDLETLNAYQRALSKLVNSLSWGREVTKPQPIDSEATIFYIDLRDYEWEIGTNRWTLIETEYPYNLTFDAPTQIALHEKLTNLRQEMNCEVPFVHVDWFLATASLPPLYHDILDLPLTDRELEAELDVDVGENIRNAAGKRVWRAGFNNSRVSSNNRVVERHRSRYGAYWKSYDFAGSVGTQNIFTHPLNFTHDGGEIIFNLPNGLQAYYLADAGGNRLDEAPISIVSNPAASDPTVRNGLSCIGCHTEGMKDFEDEVRGVVEQNENPPFDKDRALRLYVEKTVMDGLIEEDTQLYRQALEATGDVFGGIEPIQRFHEAFQAPLDVSHAAAAVGLETTVFLGKIRERTGLQNLGLLALENGTVKRDAWTSNFDQVISALNSPDSDLPPVVQRPELVPGASVQIPDLKLRAAIEKALGKAPGEIITVAEMATLTTLFDDSLGELVPWVGLQDLEGIQFATNLEKLAIVGPLSDLSRLARLTNLTILNIQIITGGDHNVDLSFLAGLTKLRELNLYGISISDISFLIGLTELRKLNLSHQRISDISSLAGLTELRELNLSDNLLSDISPLAGLTKLQTLKLGLNPGYNRISDISPLAGLTELRTLSLPFNPISDISPLSGLINLENLQLGDMYHSTENAFQSISARQFRTRQGVLSDISPLAGLTKLRSLSLNNNSISDISPLSGLINLRGLDLRFNNISDVSPLTSLQKLGGTLNLLGNNISDVSPLAKLQNLQELIALQLQFNEISDISPLDGLPDHIRVFWYSNPGFPQGGPKIEGPWLWGLLQNITNVSSRVLWVRQGVFGDQTLDFLSIASDGAVTEQTIASNGATEGNSVGEHVWTSRKIELTNADKFGDRGNIWKMLSTIGITDLDLNRSGNIVYGLTYLYSPREQKTNMFAGGSAAHKVWLNGELVRDWHVRNMIYDLYTDYEDFFPVTLKQGQNVLLVGVEHGYGNRGRWRFSGDFGFAPGTEYTASVRGLDYTFSHPEIYIGDTFTLDLSARNVIDLAGWQFDIDFDPAVLEAVEVNEDDFLKEGGGATFFQKGTIDNATGKITKLSSARLNEDGVTGTGTLLSVTFLAKAGGETRLTLGNFQFGSIDGTLIPAGPHEVTIVVEGQLATGDVNRDGQVSVLDMILVSRHLGEDASANLQADVNNDGIINIQDLIVVAQHLGESTDAAAPSVIAAINNGELTPARVQAWITQAQIENDGSIAFQQGIATLERLLTLFIPEETALLHNYPNPFNPETWVPYQLAEPAEVTLTIHSVNGTVVRTLTLGYQPAGVYQTRSRAAYWDGKNEVGEPVASGVYFYTLTAGDFNATRKMLIRK